MKKKYYDCFSTLLKEFLEANEVYPYKTVTHHKNSNTIWVYLKNDELDLLLSEWTNNRNKKIG